MPNCALCGVDAGRDPQLLSIGPGDVRAFCADSSGCRRRALHLLDPTEMLDLLALWYSRWRGYTAGTPDDMHVRTRNLLRAHGREVLGSPRA